MRGQFLSLFFLVAGAIASPVKNTTSSPILNVALIRAPPALWAEPILSREYHGADINATTSLGVKYIETAAREGANLVVFPELWFPGYPRNNNDADWIRDWGKNYVQNSITRGDANWNRLLSAARQNSVFVAFGFSERQDDYIFMAQAFFSPQGEVLIHRHKPRPSGGERKIWSDGGMQELDVVDTEYGRIGILECWEHFHPSMTFPMQAQNEAIHISSWPYMPDFGAVEQGAQAYETAEVNMAAASVYATNSGAYVLVSAVGRAAAFDSSGLEIEHLNASVSFDEKPFLLVSVNTTGFAGQKGYDVDGEQSWGVLEQIRDGWPKRVPKVKGNFT
ncbi:carbon-nitrogen hydrolase [Aspergillus unguis]